MSSDSNNAKDNQPTSGTSSSEKASGYKRLHPMTWLFILIELVKSFFIPLVILLFAGGGDNYERLGMFFIIPALVYGILQYSVYRYRLADNEIIIKEGILVKNIRHVKYSRIQNLNLSQNPVHKLFGVMQLELESASGGKPEAVMRVISLSAAEEIKQAVNRDKEGLDKPVSNDEVRPADRISALTLPLTELIRAGLISNRGLIVVAFLFGIISQTRALDGFFANLKTYIETLSGQFSFDLSHPLGMALSIILGIIAFVITIRLLSIIYMVFTFYGFELTVKQKKLFAKYGLITQLQITVPQARIQLISRVENLFHRFLKRSSVSIATAGGSLDQNGQGQSKSLRWVAPIIHKVKVDWFMQQVAPAIAYHVNDWQLIPHRAWMRIFRMQFVITLIILVPLAIWFDPFFLLLLCWLVLGVVFAKKTIASIRYGFSDNALVIQKGWIVNRFTLIPFDKIQSIDWHQGIFDRRNNMANISVDAAGLTIFSGSVNIPYLDVETANQLVNDLYYRVARTEYRWAS